MRKARIVKSEPWPRRTKPFPRDVIRLAKGAVALGLSEPTTVKEMRAQLPVLGDALAAMQSLDDLGDNEANRKAHRDMDTLLARYLNVEGVLKQQDR